jgi:hypothetical protein
MIRISRPWLSIELYTEFSLPSMLEISRNSIYPRIFEF